MAQDRFGYGTNKTSKSEFKPAGAFENIRQYIKKETGGLGGLILTTNKDTGERSFVITYADTEDNMKNNGHWEILQYLGQRMNEDENIPNVGKIQAMKK
tara:strand:- start:897 stop:1193 length:297 start_codon:yes stop_codon:yes gene_type:complete